MRAAPVSSSTTSCGTQLRRQPFSRRPLAVAAALSPLPKHSHLPQRREERDEGGHFSAPMPNRQVSAEGSVATEAFAATLAVPQMLDDQEGTTIRREQQAQPAPEPRGEFVPDDVIKEFEAKLQGDIQSVFATLVAGVGVITWWRGVWALLDHFLGDSLFGDCMCIFSGLLIILYLRFSGAKLTNFFPPS